MSERRSAFSRFGKAILAVLVLITISGCHGADRDAATALLSDFYGALKIVDDPLYKDAAMNEDAEPGRAKDYFDAHEKLRAMMVDPDRKAIVLAAFLARQPTALRLLSFKSDKDVMLATAALGPTDEKTGTFALHKTEGKWLIDDFDGAYAKRKAMVGGEDSLAIPAVPAPGGNEAEPTAKAPDAGQKSE